MILDAIALSFYPRLPRRTALELCSVFGGPAGVFEASYEELVAGGVQPDLAREINKKVWHQKAGMELEYCRRNGLSAICHTDPIFPALLKECCDHPLVIYYKGDTDILAKDKLSVVGTRKISLYGRTVCEKMISDVAAMFPGKVIVSGLAYGADHAAHKAAVQNGLATIAVMALPLPRVYPASHTAFAEEIVKKGGGLLTEYASTNKVRAGNFLERNRVIAGLSEATVIVESPARGGSMSTADKAVGYDRAVFAVPGRVGDENSEGTNLLIHRHKARIYISAAEMGRELGWEPTVQTGPPDDRREAKEPLTPAEILVMKYFETEEMNSIDTLAVKSGMAVYELSPLLFGLEMKGLLRMLPGKVYIKD